MRRGLADLSDMQAYAQSALSDAQGASQQAASTLANLPWVLLALALVFACAYLLARKDL